MQNEATNAMQERMVNNKHLADNLRQKLSKGWPEGSTFLRILGQLSNPQLVAKYFAHIAISKVPLEKLENSSIEA